MYAIGTDLATGDVLIRNYTNSSVIRIPADDIAMVARLIHDEYPPCQDCEGIMVDGYCTDCHQDVDGRYRLPADDEPVWVAPPGEHDHGGRCALCAVENGTCCDHCPGSPAYDPDAIRAILEAAP